MSRAIIHIGLPKTGTTAIQEFLASNEDRFATVGLSYPAFLGSSNHFELAVFAADGTDTKARYLLGLESEGAQDRFRGDFARRFADSTATGDWVFSSEHLASRLRSTDAIARLRRLFSRFDDIRIVVYVRPQDTMAVASYSTWVKDGDSRRFLIESHLDNAERYDFRRIIERWQEVFGPDSVEIRLYPPEGLLEDFLVAVGLDPDGDWAYPSRRSNESLDSKELAFLREMNRRLPRWERGPTRRFLDLTGAITGAKRGAPLRLAVDDRRRLLERFRDSNEWIMKHASNADLFPAYFEPEVDAPPGTMDEELTVDDALEFARALWARASQAEKRLKRLLDES